MNGLPNMTVDQAIEINSRPYGTFPSDIQSQAVGILSFYQKENAQLKTYSSLDQLSKNRDEESHQ